MNAPTRPQPAPLVSNSALPAVTPTGEQLGRHGASHGVWVFLWPKFWAHGDERAE
jgi:hypothetical protein